MSVFASGDNGTLKRIDEGVEKWSIDINADSPIGGLSLGPNRKYLYVATGSGNTLEKYDILGNRQWSVSLPAPVNDVSAGPNGDWVYIAVGNKENDYRSFEQRDVNVGDQGWQITPNIMGASGIEAGPNGNYIYGFTDAASLYGGDAEQEIYKLDANNGETQIVRSVFDSVEDLVATPDGQYVFFNAGSSDLHKANASDFTDIWVIQEPANIMGLSIGKDGSWLYLCHNRYGGVAKKSVSDGAEDWLYEGHESSGTNDSYDVSAHHKVYSAGIDGDLKQLFISDGTEGWTYNFANTVRNVEAFPSTMIKQTDAAAATSSRVSSLFGVDSILGSSYYSNIISLGDSVSGSAIQNVAGYTLYSTSMSPSSGEGITSSQIVLGPSDNMALSRQTIYEVVPTQAKSIGRSSSGVAGQYKDVKFIIRSVARTLVGGKTLEQIESYVKSPVLGISVEGTLYIWTKYESIEREIIYEIIESETSDLEYETLEEEDNTTEI